MVIVHVINCLFINLARIRSSFGGNTIYHDCLKCLSTDAQRAPNAAPDVHRAAASQIPPGGNQFRPITLHQNGCGAWFPHRKKSLWHVCAP